MICFVKTLSLTWRKLRPQTLANSPAVVHPRVSNLASRWVNERVASKRRKVAFESDGWSSSTDIVSDCRRVEERAKGKLGEREA